MPPIAGLAKVLIAITILVEPEMAIAQTAQDSPNDRPAAMNQASCDFARNFVRAVHQLDPDRISDGDDIEVELLVTIAADGTLTSVEITKKNVNNRTSNWVRREIKSCSFTPELKAGVPTAATRKLSFVIAGKYYLAAGGNLRCDFPVYPRAADDDWVERLATIRLFLDSAARPLRTEVIKTTGREELDQSATVAAMSCRSVSPLIGANEKVDLNFRFKR